MQLNAFCAAGAKVIFPSDCFEPDKTMYALKSESCNVYGVPTMFSAILASPEFEGKPIKSLRTGIMAGSQCFEY